MLAATAAGAPAGALLHMHQLARQNGCIGAFCHADCMTHLHDVVTCLSNMSCVYIIPG